MSKINFDFKAKNIESILAAGGVLSFLGENNAAGLLLIGAGVLCYAIKHKAL